MFMLSIQIPLFYFSDSHRCYFILSCYCGSWRVVRMNARSGGVAASGKIGDKPAWCAGNILK